MKEGLLKKKTVILILICRVAILLAIWLFKIIGGIAPDEFILLGCILTPVCCLYIALAIKFTRENRYLASGKIVGKSYYQTRYLLQALIYLAEFLGILVKVFFNWFTIDQIYVVVFLTECILAAYAGIFLTELFAPPGESIPDPATGAGQ